MLNAITPHTEADPAAVLLGWMTCFGSVVGRGAFFPVGSTPHYPHLFVGQVGPTSAGKGEAWGVAKWPFERIRPDWAKDCIEPGVGSGEGLIERVVDPDTEIDADGNAVTRPGATDKRCLVRLAELSRCFKAQRQEKSSLSEFLRQMWDGHPVSVPNRKNNRLRSSDYAVSVFGDITPDVLGKMLATKGGTEGEDGWMNRFLWVVVSPGRDLPSGGTMAPLEPFLDRLNDAITKAEGVGPMTRDAEAEALWATQYGELKRSGDAIPHTHRARPQVVRLAMIYALADGERVVRLPHLRAALAVWDYAKRSAGALFAASANNDDGKLAVKLSELIMSHPGIDRSGMRKVVGTRVTKEDIRKALDKVEASGFAHRVQVPTGGRMRECWHPGRGQAIETTPSPSLSFHDAGKEGRKVSTGDGDVGNERKERNESSDVELGKEMNERKKSSAYRVTATEITDDKLSFLPSRTTDEDDGAIDADAFLDRLSGERGLL